MIADSNLVIYAASGNYPDLLNWFLENKVSVSAVSLVEALGYHKLKPREKTALETIFSTLTVLYPTPEVFRIAVELRQQRALSLGDALIAATAIYHNLHLATHNIKDFDSIKSLKLLDPLEV
jgi:predicted nucleic acid-binding protein